MIVGLALTFVGTALAVAALVGDWRAHGGGAPLIPLIGRLRSWFKRFVLRQKPETHTVTAHVSTTWDVATSASGYAAPPSNAPVDVQMRFVRERLLALESRIGAERQEMDQKIARVQADTQAMNAHAQASIGELKGMVREVATGSVRLELLGLFLVGVGSIVAALPTVCGWQ